jgi:hypothetical protein
MDLLSLADRGIPPAEAAVTVGLEGAHAACIHQGEPSRCEDTHAYTKYPDISSSTKSSGILLGLLHYLAHCALAYPNELWSH